MSRRSSLLAITIAAGLCTGGRADGLIRQLPPDGTWARYAVIGDAHGSDGRLTVNIEGHQTFRSVGKESVDSLPCRWIEIDSEMKFKRERARPGAEGAEGEDFTEVQKLLIPEKFLTADADPRQHVRKAYIKDSAGKLRVLDLAGADARMLESLDEIFHSPLKAPKKLEPIEIEIKQKTFKCEGFKAEVLQGNSNFAVETRYHDAAPFGVVTYQYVKTRLRGGTPAGSRSMSWRLVDFGNDAKSELPDAK